MHHRSVVRCPGDQRVNVVQGGDGYGGPALRAARTKLGSERWFELAGPTVYCAPMHVMTQVQPLITLELALPPVPGVNAARRNMMPGS